MELYLLLIFLSGLLAIVTLVITIIGLFKKKPKLWISTLIAFVIFIALTIYFLSVLL
jgi:hypothetical protein